MNNNFDMSFGMMSRCSVLGALSMLQKFSRPKYEITTIEEALEDFTPDHYKMDWSGLKTKSRNSQYRLNTWMYFAPFLDLNLDEILEGELSLRQQFVAKWAADWIECFPFDISDPLGSLSENKFAWYDMAVGLRAAVLGHLVCLSDDKIFDESAKSILEKSAREHLQYLQRPAHWASHSNHGLYQSLGLLSLITQVPEISSNYLEDRRLAVERIKHYLNATLSDDGVHLEHTPAYHLLIFRAMNSISGFLDPASHEEGAIIETIKRMQNALSAMVMPNGLLPPLGDGKFIDMGSLNILEANSSRSYSEKLKFHISGGELGQRPLDELFFSKDAGLATYKNVQNEKENSFLAASGWFHSRVHKQMDDLSLFWAENNLPIFTDPGRYGYEGRTPDSSELRVQGFYYSDPKRIYIESAHAHNTVEIDSQTDNRRQALAYQSAFAVAAKADENIVVYDMDIIREPLVHHKRLCVYIPGRLLIVIDELDGIDEMPHDFTQWWQLFPAWTVTEFQDKAQAAINYNSEWKTQGKMNDLFDLSDKDFIKSHLKNLREASATFSDPNISIQATFAASNMKGRALPIKVMHHNGSKDDGGRLTGWTSLSSSTVQPAPAISISLDNQSENAIIFSVFEINNEGKGDHCPSDAKINVSHDGTRTISWTSSADVNKVSYLREKDSLKVSIREQSEIVLDRRLHPRNEDAQALMRARAEIAKGSSPDVIFKYFDLGTSCSWSVAVEEAAQYANKIGDAERHLALYERAYLLGSEKAIVPLALRLMKSDFPLKNLERVEGLLKQAVNNNIRSAYYHLGELYENIEYKGADRKKAKSIYLSGAQQNHTNSILRLSDLLMEDEEYADAVKWLKKVSDTNVKAQLQLGKILNDKDNFPELHDPKLALKYFTSAAEQGNMLAGFFGSKLALDKSLEFYNLDLGKKLLKISSDKGSGIASYNLAKIISREDRPDYDLIRTLLLKAQSKGIAGAETLLSKLM